MVRYIHYGDTYFDQTKIKPIKNRVRDSKPTGGLWACRVDSKYGWKDLVRDEWLLNSYYKIPKCSEDNAFIFTLSANAKVFEIDMVECLKGVPLIKEPNPENHLDWVGLDFESLMQSGYDAIELFLDPEVDWHLPHVMLGWDVSSLLVLNSAVVVPE